MIPIATFVVSMIPPATHRYQVIPPSDSSLLPTKPSLIPSDTLMVTNYTPLLSTATYWYQSDTYATHRYPYPYIFSLIPQWYQGIYLVATDSYQLIPMGIKMLT